MNDLAAVFSEVLLPIIVVAGLGYLLRRKIELDMRSINRLGIYLLSPCLVFNTLLRAEVSGGETVKMLGFTLLSMLLVGLVSLGASGLLGLDRADQSAFLLSTMFMNSGNYGLPLSRFAFGEAGFQYALMFYLAQTCLFQTLAVFIAARGQGSSKQALLQILRLPLFYAAVAALLLRAIAGAPGPDRLPLLDGLERGVQLLANSALPLLLLMLGMQLAEARPIAEGRRVALAALLRLVISMPLAYIAALLLGLGPLPTSVGVIQASMPTAVNVTILAMELNVRPQFVSSVVVVTTLASVVSLALLLSFIRS